MRGPNMGQNARFHLLKGKGQTCQGSDLRDKKILRSSSYWIGSLDSSDQDFLDPTSLKDPRLPQLGQAASIRKKLRKKLRI